MAGEDESAPKNDVDEFSDEDDLDIDTAKVYKKFVDKYFRDYDPGQINENMTRNQIFLWEEYGHFFQKLDTILRSGMYDKTKLLDLDVRIDNNNIKRIKNLIGKS